MDVFPVAIGCVVLGLTIAVAFLGFGSAWPLIAVVIGTVAVFGLAAAGARALSKASLRRSKEELTAGSQELKDLKSDFLACVSQELRMPIAAMVGFSATLTDMWDELDDDAKRGLSLRLLCNADNLNTLITELVDLSKLEAGLAVPELRPVDVSTEIHNAVRGLAIPLNHHRVQIHAHEGLLALADPIAVRRTLEALLSNAGKFSSPGSLIIARGHVSGDEVVISVDDNGMGIPEDEVDLIFDRFYRIGCFDEVRIGGMGIGLAVAKRFVETMGGKIWVEPVGGRGTTFSFTLKAYSGAAPAGHHSKLTSPMRTSSPILAPASPKAASTPARSRRP